MKKYLRANEAFFITKKQRAPIMKRSRLRNKFLKEKKIRQAGIITKLCVTIAKNTYFSNLDTKKKKVTDNITFHIISLFIYLFFSKN